MAAVLTSPETGLKTAAVPMHRLLHVAEGSAAELLSAAFCRAMVSSVPLHRAARVRTTTGTFMKSPIRFTVLSSALLFTLQASADDAARSLDRVQVTGNRIAQAAGDSGYSITVLERADIEASRSIDVIDLLVSGVIYSCLIRWRAGFAKRSTPAWGCQPGRPWSPLRYKPEYGR